MIVIASQEETINRRKNHGSARTPTSKFNLINTQYALCIAQFYFVHILVHTIYSLFDILWQLIRSNVSWTWSLELEHGDFMANFWQIGVSTDRPFSARLVRGWACWKAPSIVLYCTRRWASTLDHLSSNNARLALQLSMIIHRFHTLSLPAQRSAMLESDSGKSLHSRGETVATVAVHKRSLVIR